MSLRKELIDICHKVYEKEFVSAYDGNLSIRINDETVLITPSGKCKGDLVEDDLQIIDYRGNLVDGTGKVSTEAKVHLIAYKNRKDINSVVHCHPVYATAFATAGEGFTRAVFPEVALGLGKIHVCKYATPSTDELAESLLPYIEYAWVFLLENHGAVTLGNDIKGAYFRMEKLEHAAKTLYITRQLGREKNIPIMKLKELYSIAEKVYGVKIDKRNRMDF